MDGGLTPLLGPKPQEMPKFLCDEMLGKLAKWLRLLGYDTSYLKSQDDGMLALVAEQENRILLTRDKQLSTRVKRGLYLESEDPDEQLMMVFTTYGLTKDKALTLCSVCGYSLITVPKERAFGKVPSKIYAVQSEFWYCSRCQKFYWKGSHYDKITDRIDKLGDDEIIK
jgi:uncharacterized protein with PIN domain